ncbi:hypothetical protein ILYODFUR_000085 [Ilyodon furcidens]|uniref:Secreted protein n=1 Tax=Ilyodon furcidens TaxID=33524 RepID=A0ABV0T5C7_9TELE
MCVCVCLCGYVCEWVRWHFDTRTHFARAPFRSDRQARETSVIKISCTDPPLVASLRYNHTPHGAFAAAAAVDGTPKAHTVRRALKKVREGQASRLGTMGPSPRC